MLGNVADSDLDMGDYRQIYGFRDYFYENRLVMVDARQTDYAVTGGVIPRLSSALRGRYGAPYWTTRVSSESTLARWRTTDGEVAIDLLTDTHFDHLGHLTYRFDQLHIEAVNHAFGVFVVAHIA